MIRYTHATSDTTFNNAHNMHVCKQLVQGRWDGTARHHHSLAIVRLKKRAASASFALIIARAKGAHTKPAETVLSAFGDGETAFQMSETTYKERCISCDRARTLSAG